ncbi:MAG: hypothetical protein J6Y20_10455 [Lachnospiraceae bacterium]|nr:hypothetical protein [Lachnospiraceae bacterium]
MVKVCDAIMGTGKSSAAITYLNEHPDDKFIYITPYLAEAKRIHDSCPGLSFVEPSNNLPEYGFKKSAHTAALVKAGRNITTTHQAFKGYTPSLLDDIRAQGYTLIIDENVDVLETFDFHPADLKLAVDAGYITEHNGVYSLANEGYDGKALAEMFRLLRSRELFRVTDKNKSMFFWALPPDLLTAFKDVFILTYLFSGQSLCYFMKIYNIQYEYMGIEKTPDGAFRFCDYPGYTPEYVANLKNTLHILDNDKLNDVGDDYHALSKSWFERGGGGVEQLKKNVSNCYNNIWRDIPANRRLWGSYNGAYNQVRGKGYSKSFLTFNAKATNAYRNKDCLVYIANLFMNVNEKKFYQMHGIEVDEDAYALSIMVQWIWRSAIRDGAEVYLYIPSRRMRTLLTHWIESTSGGGGSVE